MTLAKSVPSISDRTELTYPGGGRYFKYRPPRTVFGTPTTPGVTAKSQPTNARTPWRRRIEAASSFPAEPSRPACRAEHASPPSWSRETKPPLHAVCLPSAARARVGDTVPRHRRAMLLRHPIPLLLAAPWTTCNSAFNPLALGSTVPSAARRSHPAHPWHGHRPAALSGVRIRRGADGRSDAALIERTSRRSAAGARPGAPLRNPPSSAPGTVCPSRRSATPPASELGDAAPPGQVLKCLHVPLKILTAVIVFQTKEY